MIPLAYIQAWRTHAPWPDLRQVEQDLIICRALCDLFSAPALEGKLAFRGGTAMHKLLFKQPLRYSEDIDLVQTRSEPIGTTVDAIRDALSWLGKCQREQAGHSMHLIFRFNPEADQQAALKLKVEINTREHDSLYGVRAYPFAMENGWYSGKADIQSFEPEELFGTKLRPRCSDARTGTCSTCTTALSNSPSTTTGSSPASSTTWRSRATPSPAPWPRSACCKNSLAA